MMGAWPMHSPDTDNGGPEVANVATTLFPT